MVKRNANLDLVRAAAIVMVLVFHAPEGLGELIPPLRYHGFLGVNLFFVPPQQNLWVHFGSGRFPIT